MTVTDTGPGIPAEQREHAKQRFVRLDAQRSTPGSGLGLSLVDAVAKLHDAQAELADNEPGLRVTLTFKPAPACARRAGARQGRLSAAAGTPIPGGDGNRRLMPLALVAA